MTDIFAPRAGRAPAAPPSAPRRVAPSRSGSARRRARGGHSGTIPGGGFLGAFWPEVLANYARHHEDGSPIPQELVDRILEAKQFNQGYDTAEYVAASIIDQAWHQLPAGQVPRDVAAFEAEVLAGAGLLLEAVPPRYHSTYFSHIFSSDYDAGYYSYIWSEVLVADTELWFEENGGLRRENGQRLREMILSRGGSRDAMELYRAFAGRDPEIEPLLVRRGLLDPDEGDAPETP